MCYTPFLFSLGNYFCNRMWIEIINDGGVFMQRKWTFDRIGEPEANTPCVHPDIRNGMLNRAGSDGYSFDEPDDADERDFGEGMGGMEYYEAGDVDEMREASGMALSVSSDDISLLLSDAVVHIDPVFFCDGGGHDFDAMLADTITYKADARYKTDLYSAYGLGFDLDAARKLDIREYPGCGDAYKSICDNLAYTLVDLYAGSNKDCFRDVMRNLEIPFAEAFNRRVREESMCLLDGDVSDLQMWLGDRIVSACDNLSRDEMVKFDHFTQRIEYASHYAGSVSYDDVAAYEQITKERVPRGMDFEFDSDSSAGGFEFGG